MVNFYAEVMAYFLRQILPEGNKRPLIINIKDSEHTVGRDSTKALRSYSKVSGKHASFDQTRGGVFCVKDLGSNSGLYVNGIRIHEKLLCSLSPGDVIGFGEADSSVNGGFVGVLCEHSPRDRIKQTVITSDDDDEYETLNTNTSRQLKIKGGKVCLVDQATQTIENTTHSEVGKIKRPVPHRVRYHKKIHPQESQANTRETFPYFIKSLDSQSSDETLFDSEGNRKSGNGSIKLAISKVLNSFAVENTNHANTRIEHNKVVLKPCCVSAVRVDDKNFICSPEDKRLVRNYFNHKKKKEIYEKINTAFSASKQDVELLSSDDEVNIPIRSSKFRSKQRRILSDDEDTVNESTSTAFPPFSENQNCKLFLNDFSATEKNASNNISDVKDNDLISNFRVPVTDKSFDIESLRNYSFLGQSFTTSKSIAVDSNALKSSRPFFPEDVISTSLPKSLSSIEQNSSATNDGGNLDSNRKTHDVFMKDDLWSHDDDVVMSNKEAYFDFPTFNIKKEPCAESDKKSLNIDTDSCSIFDCDVEILPQGSNDSNISETVEIIRAFTNDNYGVDNAEELIIRPSAPDYSFDGNSSDSSVDTSNERIMYPSKGLLQHKSDLVHTEFRSDTESTHITSVEESLEKVPDLQENVNFPEESTHKTSVEKSLEKSPDLQENVNLPEEIKSRIHVKKIMLTEPKPLSAHPRSRAGRSFRKLCVGKRTSYVKKERMSNHLLNDTKVLSKGKWPKPSCISNATNFKTSKANGVSNYRILKNKNVDVLDKTETRLQEKDLSIGQLKHVKKKAPVKTRPERFSSRMTFLTEDYRNPLPNKKT